MADLSGQYLGRYYLLERLGEGGMAVVYKAYDTRLERDVAVKIIRSGAFPAEALDEVSKRFEREAKSLAKLSHPNIVKVHDYGEHEGAPYLVMEYLPGGTLKKILGKPVPWQVALRLLLPVARGVAYAHQRGILHRDIKPANILITEHGDPMLSDFGIAKLFEADQTTNLTGTGMVIGTPEYMAPEQWTGQPTPQSDLYSLGIVLYEMVAGRKPYMADTPASILLKQATETLPPPRKFVSGLPEAMEFLLIKALAREPRDRFADVNALIQAMETLLLSAPTVQSGHADPDAALKETLAAPPPAAADAPAQIELQDDGGTVLPSPSRASNASMPKGHTIPPGTGQTGSSRSISQPRRGSQIGMFAFFGGAGLFAIFGVVVIILILMPSIMPKFAKPVLTATFSPIPPTAYPTPTASATPTPVLGFTLVEPQETLKIAAGLKTLTELAYEKYSDADHNKVNTTLTFTVNAKPGVPILWSSGWCAINDQILEENLTKINFVFEADGYVVPLERLAQNTYEVTAADSDLKGWKCLEYLTVLRDWKPGTYKFVETISFSSAINDGKVAFDAGNMIRKYTVNISE
ncbi:MAG TPA: serine/threonine-protein kinase [Anaerolineales bacterium]|nr:serine/threonine-protein kinase [Anaerolineales bacterium]